MNIHRNAQPRFVVCIDNTGYAASLELRKLYQLVADADAAALGQVRVIDESGEDYLYPSQYFAAVELPEPLEATLLRAS